MGEMITSHIRTTDNVSDLGIKVIPGGQKGDYLVGKLLYDLTDWMK